MFFLFFFAFFGPTQKMGPDGPKWGQEVFFLLIQTLPTFWATRILIMSMLGFYAAHSPGPARPTAQAQPKPGLEIWEPKKSQI